MLRTRGSKRTGVALLCSAALLSMAGTASAITIYSFDNLGTTNAGTNGDRFIRFDSANPTGTVVTLGSSLITNRGMSGLDFAGNNTLYSCSGFNSDGTAFAGSQLFTVNPANGNAVLVGNMNLPAGYAATDMSWNPVLGQMMMIAAAGTANPMQLYTVNLGNGAATLVGNISGAGTPGSLDVGLASNSAGINFVHDIVSDRMYSLAGTVATAMPSAVGMDCNFSQGMTINWAGGNEWFLGAIGSVPGFFGRVVSINNATGAGTTVPNGTWPLAGNGLPQYETGDLAIPIPEPGSLALVGISAAAMVRRRRGA